VTPTLTDEQSEVVQQLLDGWRKQSVQTLGGYAGCGKTTCLATLAEELPRWATCAFTGRAAHVMRQKGMDARTIHGLIYLPREEKDGAIVFDLRSKYDLGDVQGFLVDEASMVGESLLDDLLSFDLPVIFVGDHGQLPPVGGDVNLMKDPDYKLETVHRNAGDIAHFAEHLRCGRPAGTFPTKDAVKVLPVRDMTDERLLAAGQVIVAFNKSRVGINERIRSRLGRQNLLETGDRIISLRNSRKDGLFNGLMGTVVDVDLGDKEMIFQSDGDGSVYDAVPFDPEVFGAEKYEIKYGAGTPHPFDYSYAVTCHKAQGGEWPRVTVFEQRCDKLWDHKRWAYTAASRAREQLLWLTP
jgi:exodeoxyribonuclease-5